MPAAVIGLALVAAEAITVTTLSYIALGVTVAGMVTGNKTLTKIGGQLGLAAGVAGIATSFMSGAPSMLDAIKGAVGIGGQVGNQTESMTAAQQDAATNYGMDGQAGATDATNAAGNQTTLHETPKAQFSTENLDTREGVEAYRDRANAAAVEADKANTTPLGSASGAGSGAYNKVTQTDILGTQGTDVGILKTANDPNTQAFHNRDNDYLNNDTRGQEAEAGGFYGFLKNMGGKISNASDSNKYLMAEGGKIIAGGIQGMSTTSNANARMAEERRMDDIKRANAKQVARSSYGLMRG